jgi:hypothetical protein
MTARLVINATAYVLWQLRGSEWVELAALQRGAAALLPDRRPADEAGLERAIEVAEDWLMPHARSVEGEELEVVDSTGRLASGLSVVLAVSEHEWSTDRVEEMFLLLVDMATGRGRQIPGGQRAFVADMLLIRELAHHAGLGKVRLMSNAQLSILSRSFRSLRYSRDALARVTACVGTKKGHEHAR